MYKHVLVDANNKVISIHYLRTIVPESGNHVDESVQVGFDWVYHPETNTYSQPES